MNDDCREVFEKKFKTLDLTKTRDAWDRTIYAHSHIQAMFEGYEAAWNARTPPAKPDIYALIAEVREEIKATGDSYYIKALDLADKNCRGSQYKLENGKFTDDDLKWHCQHHELIGKHRGLYEALEKLTAALKDKGV